MVLTTDYDSINTKKCKLQLLYTGILIFTVCFIFFTYRVSRCFQLMPPTYLWWIKVVIFISSPGYDRIEYVWFYIHFGRQIPTEYLSYTAVSGLKYGWQRTWKLKGDKLYNFAWKFPGGCDLLEKDKAHEDLSSWVRSKNVDRIFWCQSKAWTHPVRGSGRHPRIPCRVSR